MIVAENISKEYVVSVKSNGLLGMAKSLFKSEKRL